MEDAELDEMAELDHLVSLIKAEALQHSEARLRCELSHSELTALTTLDG